MQNSRVILSNLVFLSILGVTNAGLMAYGICQSGCNALAVACYGAAGATFGTMTAGAGIPAVILACNTGLGTCMVACIAAGCAPTP
ncbi:MAG: hypothetical protein JOS17DRAFT_380799 [Linnemannia elongata]|nr:MAG: hypothetical protein JOS17DRAFT_380799 [Linnemannia elongata]